MIEPDIETTADGSQTLRHPLSGEAYHSSNGALAESMHIFIGNGLALCPKGHIHILEAGFGSGLNAWLTLKYAAQHGLTIEYDAIELYPVGMATVRRLQYAEDPAFVRLHEAPWNERASISDTFTLRKTEADLAAAAFDTTYDLVYFDAFAPDAQPELWSPEIFRKIYDYLAPEGALVTYSAKGDVKRALRSAGFSVARLPGAPGKRHMLRAVKRG